MENKMETKSIKVVNKTKKKHKYRSPFSRFGHRGNDSSLFAIFIYTLLEILYSFYYLYKISPLFIRILFWIIIVALIIWIATRPIKETDNPATTTTNPTIPNNKNPNETNKL